jgi:hypothetical protein
LDFEKKKVELNRNEEKDPYYSEGKVLLSIGKRVSKYCGKNQEMYY